jgi:pimeloyl-ACP methyl ester carboxylesterase
LDLAGFGGSQPPETAWGLKAYATHVRDTLLKIAITQSDISVLVGHSNGGAIAVMAVSEGLLSPKSLVLIASAGVRNIDDAKKTSLKLLTKFGKGGSLLLPKSKREALRKKYYASIGSDMLAVPHMEATYKRIIKEDIVQAAEKITVPTLLIYGELDTATPPSHGVVLQQAIRGSDLRVVQGADHFVHQHHTDDVLEYMRKFLS